MNLPDDYIIAHQRFQVDHARRLETVFGAEALWVIFQRFCLPHARLDVKDVRFVRDELETVLVAGDDAAVYTLGLAAARYGADQIVGFPAGEFIAFYAHLVEYFLEDGHLHGQLLRHALSLSLVEFIAQMAEGRLTPVEGHTQRVRLLLREQLLQYGEKAVYAVGGRAVRGGEHTNAEKGAVDDAVAVEHEQFHGFPP